MSSLGKENGRTAGKEMAWSVSTSQDRMSTHRGGVFESKEPGANGLEF